MLGLIESACAPSCSLAFQADPYPTYGYLRSLAPVHRDEAAPIWHVVAYDEVHTALRDPRVAG